MRESLNIPVWQIETNRYQPRLEFNEESLEELAESIREHGLIQPITVRKVGEGYEIIAGERRFRACKKIGYYEVPCIVMSADEIATAQMALVENIQRENLSAIEEAKAYVEIMRQAECTQEELAQKMGKSQSTVANKIRLLNLPDEIQNAVKARKITERHARAILSARKEDQKKVFDQIVKKGLNVAQSEHYIKSLYLYEERQKPKPQNKGVVRHLRIALNTIYQAVKMVKDVGMEVEVEECETAEDYRMIIKFPKR
ncbi:MAG: nucleoid occlusion protein [Erysipelotrichaceae bacterium]|nr:nucleoid occlusion protein [Erysipelotrichaceae bacterium]